MDAGLDYLRKQLTEQKNNLTETIISGSAENFSEYKYQIGIIEGLTMALEEIKLTEKNLYNDTEEGD
tara:strand:+ start:6438 stop:6638 length:201 start_codon:yes stop_codon:yes gene_type:complete